MSAVILFLVLLLLLLFLQKQAKEAEKGLLLFFSLSPRPTLQAYNISWTCSGCYSQRSGSKVSLKDTTTRVSNLERDQTYNFYVYANTNCGRGEKSTTTATISRYFGQVRNLKQSFTNYTLTLEWEKPSDVEARDIKVPTAIHSLGRNVYCVVRHFCGSLISWISDFLYFARTNFCDCKTLVFLAGYLFLRFSGSRV